MQFEIHEFELIDSTNLEVKRAIEQGKPEGFAVMARSQTGGYGRQGRRWASPEGGLYLSLLLRPNVPAEQLPTLSLVAGLAVREALVDLLANEAASRIKLKWPNDVVLDVPARARASSSGALLKLAGISLEAHRGALCLGVGVNVAPPLELVELAGKNRPVYLADLGFAGAPVEVAEAFLLRFASLYAEWQGGGFAPFVEAYDACAYLAGQAVRISDMAENALVEGVVCGTDSCGRLLVNDGAHLVPVSSGEAHLL